MQRRVDQCGPRRRAIDRRQGRPLGRAPRVRPHRRLVRCHCKHPGQRFHPEGRWHSALHRSRLRRPCVTHTVHRELDKRRTHRRPITTPAYYGKTGGRRPLYAGVHLRPAQDQGLAQCCIGPAAMGLAATLNSTIRSWGFSSMPVYSPFANSEYRRGRTWPQAASRGISQTYEHGDKPMQASVCTNANRSIRRRSLPTRRQPSRDGMCRSGLRPMVQARISPVQHATSERGS